MIIVSQLIFTRCVSGRAPSACPTAVPRRLPRLPRRCVAPAAATAGSLSPSGYPGDHPCSTKGAPIQSHYDEDQCMLQRGTMGVRQERYGEAELH
jgi:hypothetical protein